MLIHYFTFCRCLFERKRADENTWVHASVSNDTFSEFQSYPPFFLSLSWPDFLIHSPSLFPLFRHYEGEKLWINMKFHKTRERKIHLIVSYLAVCWDEIWETVETGMEFSFTPGFKILPALLPILVSYFYEGNSKNYAIVETLDKELPAPLSST